MRDLQRLFNQIMHHPAVTSVCDLDTLVQTIQRMQTSLTQDIDRLVSHLVYQLGSASRHAHAPTPEALRRQQDPAAFWTLQRGGQSREMAQGDTTMGQQQNPQQLASSPSGTAGSPPLPLPFPLPPTFPPGVNPQLYRREVVTNLIQRASAYLNLFSVSDPTQPDIPITAPGNPQTLVGIEVFENSHRFDVTVERSPQGHLRATNILGQILTHIHVHFRIIPDDFVAAPDRLPPPTPLDPTRSQRFAIMDGEFSLADPQKSLLHGFGTGLTFPAVEGGQQRLRLVATIGLTEGTGGVAGLVGLGLANGYIIPPQIIGFNILVRLMNPSGGLRASSALTPLQQFPDPDPGATFMTFHGEVAELPKFNIGPAGQLQSVSVHEKLRLVHLDADLGRSGKEFRSSVSLGQIVGELRTTLFLNVLEAFGDSPFPAPFYTQNSRWTFYDRHGQTIGTTPPDILEGRVLKYELPGAPGPVLRMGGFGPIQGGTGQFSGVEGMLTVNGCNSVFPAVFSNLYVMRVVDPDGRFREACHQAWS